MLLLLVPNIKELVTVPSIVCVPIDGPLSPCEPIDSDVVEDWVLIVNPRPHPNSPPIESFGAIKYSAPKNVRRPNPILVGSFDSVILANLP